MMFDVIVTYALQDCDTGFPIRYRFKCFNDDALTELGNHYANQTLIVSCTILGIAPKSRAKVCAQWRMSLSHPVVC